MLLTSLHVALVPIFMERKLITWNLQVTKLILQFYKHKAKLSEGIKVTCKYTVLDAHNYNYVHATTEGAVSGLECPL